MIERKPAIRIYYVYGNQKEIREILAGIEEEQVLAEIYEKRAENLEELTIEAARESVIGVGIGVIGNQAALGCQSHRQTTVIYTSQEEMRRLGANAARYVKGIPFKL